MATTTSPSVTAPHSLRVSSVTSTAKSAGTATSASTVRAQAPSRAQAPVRLTTRGRRVVAALVALPITVILAVGGAHRANAADQHPFTTVVVQPGQSLWQIAALVDPTADPRDLIYQIEQINDLSGASVAVGQQLVVPAVAG